MKTMYKQIFTGKITRNNTLSYITVPMKDQQNTTGPQISINALHRHTRLVYLSVFSAHYVLGLK
jgi:hypothetical protein